jgi:hypothetical protein
MLVTATADIDLFSVVASLSRPRDQRDIVQAVLENIGEEGVITELRAMVNDPRWDDEAPSIAAGVKDGGES